MIEGREGVEACYWLAGVTGSQVAGHTLRELWWKYCGRMQAIRQHVVWQAELIARSFTGQRLNVQAFIRCGTMSGGSQGRLTMSPETRRKVEEEQGRMNRERLAREKANGAC